MQTAGSTPPFAYSCLAQAIKRGGSCHTTDAKRKFVSVNYQKTPEGFDADVPVHCPCGGDGKPCRIHRHGRRERVFGPGHALLIVRCMTHGHTFTLYPIGWFPWGRSPLATRDGDWTKTVFAAAILAANDDLWPEAQEGEYSPLATTQRRQIALCARWLGLDGDRREGEAACEALGVRLAHHMDARKRWSRASGRAQRGKVIRDVLEAVPEDGRLVQRMLRVVIKDRFKWSHIRSTSRKTA